MFTPRLSTRANPGCWWVLSHPAHGSTFQPTPAPSAPIWTFSQAISSVRAPLDYEAPTHGLWGSSWQVAGQNRVGQCYPHQTEWLEKKKKPCTISIYVACDSQAFYFADSVIRVTLCKIFAELGKTLLRDFHFNRTSCFFWNMKGSN